MNRVLTHPDFAARNKWVLERLWGAQLPGAPGRWPQFKHFPRLQILELTCDQQVGCSCWNCWFLRRLFTVDLSRAALVPMHDAAGPRSALFIALASQRHLFAV